MEMVELSLPYLAVAVSFFALYFSNQANKKTEKGFKETFKNTLRENIKKTKYLMMSERVKSEKVNILTEEIKDNLMYQSYDENKKSYLTKFQQIRLSALQESIEDNLTCIKLETDIDTNINQAISNLNSFIEQLE